MKNIALARFCTGSCGTDRAASTERLRRYCAEFGPPSGSDSVNPAEALAPIITIRSQGGLAAAFGAGAGATAAGGGPSAAPTATPETQQRASSRAARRPFLQRQ